MPAILLVKTSSLGDVVHNLPVASDIARAMPHARIDWVVEQSFAAIPRLHPNVNTVFTCTLRKWRKSLLSRSTWQGISSLKVALKSRRYDAVIDTQGLLKSASLTALASGPKHGLDWRSSREPLRLFYDHVHAIPWGHHAVERNRQLAAQALGYQLDSPPDYGIRAPDFPPRESDDDSPREEAMPWQRDEDHASRYGWAKEGPWAVLLHGSSADRKLWPEHQWKKLISHLGSRGLRCVLPWGNDREHARADGIAANLKNACVPPAMGLRTLAGLLGHARVVIGVDTGLTHLAAALGTPTVGIYVATNPRATGVYGSPFAVNLGSPNQSPSLNEVVSGINQVWKQTSGTDSESVP